jgi:hypothetical protein
VTGLPVPATVAEAAQLIADAYNTAAQAGFYLYYDEGHINVSDMSTGRGHAEAYEDHTGTWQVLT